MNSINTYNLNSLCRLCFQRHEHLLEIFDQTVNLKSEEYTLLSKIESCLSFKILPTELAPHKICKNCLQMINLWYDFKQSCQSANEIFQKHLLEKTKSMSFYEVDKLPPTEDSISFPEVSLFGYDALLERSVSLESNISSILNFCFNPENTEAGQLSEKSKSADLKLADSRSGSESTAVTKDSLKSDKKGYDCKLCNQHFTHFSNLLSHDENAHSTIIRNYTCKLCGRVFILQSRLDIHTKFAHRNRSFRCSICDKLFVSLKSLNVHGRLHSEKYKCENCGYVTTSKLYLNQHRQKHLGADVTFDCTICQKKFTQRSSLLRHQNLHLRNRGKFFKCSLCFLVFRSHSELLSHANTHESTPSESFVCKICHKSYKSKKVLYTHSKTHDNPKFACSICEKKTTTKYELQIHLGTHSDCKSFDCFHCKKKFSFKNTLIRHVKKHFPRIRSDIIT